MVKYNPNKIKDSNNQLSIGIKKNYEARMKPKKISELFNISKQRINYWIHHSVKNKRKRRTKLTRNEKILLIKWAKDKPTNLASAKKIQRKFNNLKRNKKENKLPKKISLSTVNKTLNNCISKPKNIRKVFF